VLYDGAPFIKLAMLSHGVVPFLLLIKGLNRLLLLVERFLNTVDHLERIHNCISTSLLLHFNFDFSLI